MSSPYQSNISQIQARKESEFSVHGADDSFLKRDLEKLKMMWKNVKDQRNVADNISYDNINQEEDPQQRSQKYSYNTQGSEKKYTGDDERFVEGGRLAYNSTTAQPDRRHSKQSREYHSVSTHQNMEQEVRSLRDKLAFSESRMIKLQDFNKNLFEKLNRAEEELAQCYDKMTKQNYTNQVKSIEIEDLNTRMSAVSVANQNEIENLRKGYEELKVNMIEKSYQIEKLETLLQEKEEELEGYRSKEELFSEKEFDSVLQENRHLREKIAETERNLDNFYMLRKNESAILLENERQKEDIKRLLKLLQQTSEFEDFANKANLCEGEIRFLNHSYKLYGAKRRKIEAENQGNTKANSKEALFWVPLDAFKFAHDLRIKYKGEFNEEILEMILFEMSKIWRAKEEKIISNLKDKHQKEMNLIKQKYAQTGDYGTLVQKKMASRLKQELGKSKKQLDQCKKLGKTSEMGLLVDTIRGVTEGYNKSKSLEVQNRLLVQKLQKLKEQNINPNSNRAYFVEGAMWIYDSIQHELQKLLINIHDVIEDYNEKIRAIEDADTEESKYRVAVSRNKYTMERIEDIMNGLFENFKGLKGRINNLETNDTQENDF